MSIPSRVLISSNSIMDRQLVQYLLCQSLQGFSYLLTLWENTIECELLNVSIPSRVLISSNPPLKDDDLKLIGVSIPSRVLISSNNKKMFMMDSDEECQSLQGFSYLLTLETQLIIAIMLVSIPSRVLISSNLFKVMRVGIKFYEVSIPSRVLISSNTVLAIPLFLYAHTSLCGADSFFTVSSHPYICQNAFQPSIHAMRG